MSTGYSLLAKHYDNLMGDVPYNRWIRFIDRHARLLAKPRIRIIDAGCGTGTVTIGLGLLGHEMVGIDECPEMLSAARFKADQNNLSAQWIQQRFSDLQTEADLVICTCDGINHIPSVKELVGFFSRASSMLNPNGYFIFDINSPHKYRNLLANNIFAWQMPGLDVVWTNKFSHPVNYASITMYSHLKDDLYSKSELEIIQRCYTLSSLLYYLRQSSFKLTGLWNNYGGRLKSLTSPRITLVAQKVRRS